MKTLMQMALAMLFSLSALLISCSKDEPGKSVPDYSIESSETFEVLSSYENGWIEQAIHYDANYGLKMAELAYHENGYIKNCKNYGFANGQYSPAYHYLEMEVSRDVNNLPTQTIYYNNNGSINAQIDYEAGILKKKTIYSGDQIIVSTYANGRIESIESNLNEGKTTILYNYTDGIKEITVLVDGNLMHEAELPLISGIGEGISIVDHHPRANRFIDENSSTNTINQSYASSYSWTRYFEPTQVMPVPIVYSESNFFGLLNGYFSREFDSFRMVVEEFPYFEDEFLFSNFTILDEEISFYPSIASSNEVSQELTTDKAGFELKYGQEFLRKRIIGKYGFTIGVLRNLPSDPILRDQLKDLAYRKTGQILGGETSLTIAEETMLSKVFFEYKFYSPVLGISGKVLASHDDYLNAIEQIENNESNTIQKIYKAYDLL